MNEFTYKEQDLGMDVVWVIVGTFVFFAFVYAFVRFLRFWYVSDRQAEKFLNNQTIPNIVANLTGLDFEAWTAALLSSIGARASHQGGSFDHGVDVAAELDGKKIAVQCKKYYGGKLVGERSVRELYGAMVGERYDRALLVTTSNFTFEAKKWAKGKPGLVLVNAKLLERIIQNSQMLKDLLK